MGDSVEFICPECEALRARLTDTEAERDAIKEFYRAVAGAERRALVAEARVEALTQALAVVCDAHDAMFVSDGKMRAVLTPSQAYALRDAILAARAVLAAGGMEEQ